MVMEVFAGVGFTLLVSVDKEVVVRGPATGKSSTTELHRNFWFLSVPSCALEPDAQVDGSKIWLITCGS